jgi:4-hydroxybenzoate polyprenyltransferase
MLAGLRIVASVVAYRVRNLEMANLAAAGSIAVALHLPWSDVAFRTLYCFVLNALVYLNNDYIDVQIDLQSADKDAHKSRYLADNRKAALHAQWMLVGLLTAGALLYDYGLLVPLVFGGGICVWYSAQLKRRPFADIVSMMIWGFTMPLCGSPVTHPIGLLLAGQLGLFSGVFETIQVIRDADADAQEGVRTTAVALGKPRTLRLAQGLMVLTTGYALLFMLPWAAAISSLALIIPFTPDKVERYWTRVKLVYGVAWLIICAWVYFFGRLHGLAS